MLDHQLTTVSMSPSKSETSANMLHVTTFETAPEAPRLVQHFYFPSAVYTTARKDFIESVKPVFDENIAKAKLISSNNPTGLAVMSGNFSNDARISEFTQFVASAAWKILEGQGYDMKGMATFFTGMWGQQHSKSSSMPEHVHPGAQLVGFYFLETPPESSKIQIHDPRPAKIMVNMPESNASQTTGASSIVSFTPAPGMLFFANSWLPHSFTRHDAHEPLSFVHFNLGVLKTSNAVSQIRSGAEVI